MNMQNLKKLHNFLRSDAGQILVGSITVLITFAFFMAVMVLAHRAGILK